MANRGAFACVKFEDGWVLGIDSRIARYNPCPNCEFNHRHIPYYQDDGAKSHFIRPNVIIAFTGSHEIFHYAYSHLKEKFKTNSEQNIFIDQSKLLRVLKRSFEGTNIEGRYLDTFLKIGIKTSNGIEVFSFDIAKNKISEVHNNDACGSAKVYASDYLAQIGPQPLTEHEARGHVFWMVKLACDDDVGSRFPIDLITMSKDDIIFTRWTAPQLPDNYLLMYHLVDIPKAHFREIISFLSKKFPDKWYLDRYIVNVDNYNPETVHELLSSLNGCDKKFAKWMK